MINGQQDLKLESPALENPKVETLDWTGRLKADSPIYGFDFWILQCRTFHFQILMPLVIRLCGTSLGQNPLQLNLQKVLPQCDFLKHVPRFVGDLLHLTAVIS